MVHSPEAEAGGVARDDGVAEGVVKISNTNGHLFGQREVLTSGVETVNIRAGVILHVPVTSLFQSTPFGVTGMNLPVVEVGV